VTIIYIDNCEEGEKQKERHLLHYRLVVEPDCTFLFTRTLFVPDIFLFLHTILLRGEPTIGQFKGYRFQLSYSGLFYYFSSPCFFSATRNLALLDLGLRFNSSSPGAIGFFVITFNSFLLTV